MENGSKKTAIVTGSSRGIGAEIAKRLAEGGMNVVVNYSGNKAEADAVVDGINRSGVGKATVVKADVSDVDDVKRLFEIAEEAYGGVDVLVNNAGIMKLSSIAEADDESFDQQIAVNLKGTFNTLREAAKRLRNEGSIVNISSSVVGLNLENYAIYAATKAAVETLTKIFAKEMRGRKINVNAVAPGPTATDLFFNGKSDEVVEKLKEMAPLERLGQPEDIAGVVAFLASPEGSWINAQVLRANGGIV